MIICRRFIDFIIILAMVLICAGFLQPGIATASAEDGALVGTVELVKQSTGDIIVKFRKEAGQIAAGNRLYVRVKEKSAVMKVSVSLKTGVVCQLEGKYRGYAGAIAKGFAVYRYQGSIEKEGLKKVGGVEFVYIPGGSFLMGSPDSSEYKSEHPRHKVTLNPFWIGAHELTQKVYMEIMGSNPSVFKGNLSLPVEMVTWFDAKDFCRKFSKKYKVATRLPTEAEWEYSCRGGTSTVYYWGNQMDDRYCWYKLNSNGSTHPVGGKLPNAWGLFDMSGNVYEWCEDWYDTGYYSWSSEKNPWGPAKGTRKVPRGGACVSKAANVRSANRLGNPPGIKGPFLGFRLVLSD